jgi:hypothetical protein
MANAVIDGVGLNGPESIAATAKALHAFEQSIGPGERNSGNPSNNYASTRHECNVSLLANSGSAQNIGPGGTTPVFLMGIQIHTALAGTLTVNGFSNPDGTAAAWVIPASAVGAVLPPGSARRAEGGCTMTCATAADGPKVLVEWRPIQ